MPDPQNPVNAIWREIKKILKWTLDGAEWEKAKSAISRHYLEEDMYKRRLAKWGFQKKVRGQEAFAVVRAARVSAAVGGSTSSALTSDYGSGFAPERIDRYLKRKYHSESEFLAAMTAPSLRKTPRKDLRSAKETTMNVSNTERPSPPFGSAQLLEIVASLRTYFTTSFSDSSWRISRDPNIDVYSTRPHGNDMLGLKALFSAHDLACELFDTNQVAEAGVVLSRAGSGIQDLIKTRHPRMLTAIFDLIFHLIRRRRPEVAMILLRHFSSLVSVLLGSTHPISQAFERLLKAPRLEFQPYLLLAWQSAIDRFADPAGPLHYSTLSVRREYIQMAIGLDDVALAAHEVRELAERCECELGSEDLRTLKLYYTLAELLFEQQRSEEFVHIGEKMVHAAANSVDTDYDRFVDLSCSGLFFLAKAQCAQGMADGLSVYRDQAAVTLWRAIELCISHRGLRHPLAMKYMVCLEAWARQWGDDDLLSAVQDRRAKSLALS
ncbi:hypothetical protein LTR67_001699 [Exophiala xenobiotica]